jgi:Peptidase C13 family
MMLQGPARHFASLTLALFIVFAAPVSRAAEQAGTRPAAHVAVLAFGLFGDQSVFDSEARGAARIVAQRLGGDPVVVRANTKTRADVSVRSVAATVQMAAEKMDRDNDILLLILTSHGSQDGLAVEAHRRLLETLSPMDLAGIIDRAGVRHRIVIISACYSGVFIPALANDDTRCFLQYGASPYRKPAGRVCRSVHFDPPARIA